MHSTISSILALFSLILLQSVHAQTTSGQYQEELLIAGDDTLTYRILLPTEYDGSQAYPLLLFLHGSGERGTDNHLQLTHGGQLFADSIERYPSIVVFPQCPADHFWSLDTSTYRSSQTANIHDHPSGGSPLDLVILLIHQLTKEYNIDDRRLYIAGLSMGGYGTFDILRRYPNTFAAAAIICGGVMNKADTYPIQTPIWFYHGSEDDVVPTSESVHMADGVAKAGGHAEITIYPGVDHNSWDPAFAEPKFLQRLYSQHK